MSKIFKPTPSSARHTGVQTAQSVEKKIKVISSKKSPKNNKHNTIINESTTSEITTNIASTIPQTNNVRITSYRLMAKQRQSQINKTRSNLINSASASSNNIKTSSDIKNPSASKPQTTKNKVIKSLSESIEANQKNNLNNPSELSEHFKLRKNFLKSKRFFIALSSALFSVFAIGYFLNINLPNLPARVAALQAGFDIKYPAYLPNGYNLSGITSNKNNSVNIYLTNKTNRITITEEVSPWDSQALLNNFVKKHWQNKYIISREQGLTIYMSGSNATWVNGGILYKIETRGNVDITQIYNIIYSL